MNEINMTPSTESSNNHVDNYQYFAGQVRMPNTDYMQCTQLVNQKIANGANKTTATKEVILWYKTSHQTLEKTAKLMKEAAKESMYAKMGLQSVDGKIVGNNSNYCAAINYLYNKKIEYNEFTEFVEVERVPISDYVYTEIYALLSDNLGSTFEVKTKIQDAVDYIAHQHTYHPVKEYLESLKWDGTKRAANMFVHYLGADDNKVIKWMTTIWLYAAIKRIYEPGCKFDNILILQGAQGAGKSVMCQRLAKSKFYTENINIGDKDAYLDMQHSWIVIEDELASMSKKESNDVKNFLSKTEDTYRAPYAHTVTSSKRHCVFIGSTNEETFLKDNTSIDERRYWIIKCQRSHKNNIVFNNFTDEVVDQIWAEIFTLYKSNQNISLNMDVKMYDEYMEIQREFKMFNDDPIFNFLDDALNRDYRLNDKGCFNDDNDLMKQYKSMDDIPESLTLGKIQRVSTNSIRMLLTDNKFKLYKTVITNYASWNSNTWEYKKMKINGISVWGLERISSDISDSENEKVPNIKLEGLDLFEI